LDPSLFFRNELAQAIREIRADYEAVIDSQRTELNSRHTLMYNELIIKQQKTDSGPAINEQQRRSEERFRSELLQIQNQNGYLRAKNQEVKNRIDELKRKLSFYREENTVIQVKWSKQIEEAKRRLELANRDFDEVSNLKTSLEKEITTYRELLESKNILFFIYIIYSSFNRSKWSSWIC
jgi:predicted RNase H-like nuclease (RuvC/YqgF family)